MFRPVRIIDRIGEHGIPRFPYLGDHGWSKVQVISMNRRTGQPLGDSAPVIGNHPEQHAAGDSRRASLRGRQRILLKA